MLIKLIFLVQLNLSPQGEKEKKIRTIHKSGGPQRDKILRRLKKGTRNDIFRKRTLRLRGLFEFLLPVVNLCRPAPFDTLLLITSVLFLLKKLLLLSILVICRILHYLMYEDINGN